MRIDQLIKPDAPVTFPSLVRLYGDLARLELIQVFDPAAWSGKGPVAFRAIRCSDLLAVGEFQEAWDSIAALVGNKEIERRVEGHAFRPVEQFAVQDFRTDYASRPVKFHDDVIHR